MPKKVDHNQRKKKIAVATYEVIRKKGIEGATVRNISEEAGISLGSLRHYFQSQDELYQYAMDFVVEKVGNRMLTIMKEEKPLIDKVVAVLIELIPTNEQSLTEMEVWFAFTNYARHHSNFDPQSDHIYDIIFKLLILLEEENLLKDKIEKDNEVETLYALTDGLALHALLDPKRLNSVKVRKVIENYILSICELPEK